MRKSWGIILISASLLALVDQIIKAVISSNPEKQITIFENFFKIVYSENRGIAFGIEIPFVLILSILLIPIIVFFGLREIKMEYPLSKIASALVLGGAIGNIIDRIAKGFVVDYISIWKWPIFNLADIFIVAGILLLIIFYDKIKR